MKSRNDTYSVEFRIEGKLLVPSEVTLVLDLEPCRIENGDTLNSVGKRRVPLWSYDGLSSELVFSENEWDSIEEGLQYLLRRLSPKKELIQALLGGHKIYWWCGHFQQSFDGKTSFSPTLLKELSDFGVPLIVSNYHSE